MKTQLQITLVTVLTLLSGFAVAAPSPDEWAFWNKSDAESVATIDHSLWQGVLDSYVRESPDNINRFAYAELLASRANEKENAGEGKAQLTNYLAAMANIDPRNYNNAVQQAYWINVYNALTVDVVLRYPKKNSILRMGERFFSSGPWDDEVFSVAGKNLTLNDIEHRILRPIFEDHRVHYAVNCASIGCPNLAASAFSGEQLDDQLAAAEAGYINHSRGVTLDKKGNLQLSQIYDWYVDDFADDEAGLVQYLAKHNLDFGAQLKNFSGKVSYDYDWDLNKAK